MIAADRGEGAHECRRGHGEAIELAAWGLGLGEWLRSHKIGRTDPSPDHEALDQVGHGASVSGEVDFDGEHSAGHGVHAAEQHGRYV